MSVLDAPIPPQYNPAMSLSQAKQPTAINYGGQAVIEGVMMRGAKSVAVSVRNPEGEIITHIEPLNQHIYGGRLAKTPFLRGLILLWDALGLGIRALMFSADVALEEEEKGESALEDPHQAFSGPAQWGMVAISFSLTIGLFFVLPTLLASGAARLLGFADVQVVVNLLEGLVRLMLLISYIWAIGLMDDIRRLYGYHGAEHKTINAFEAGAELTPEEVARFPLEHPRCGTAFLLTVVVISIVIYTILPEMSLLMRIVSRILLLPFLAGISYEFLRFTARNQANPFIRLITKPNLALQRLTTREPDRGMLEVAISAFEQMRAMEADESMIAPEPKLT